MKTQIQGFCHKLAYVAALACLLCIGLNSASFAESDKLAVRVMTRNMDAGTDLNYVTQDGVNFEEALQKTFAEVYASNIPARAEQLAEEIATVKPDLIALQEVTAWTIPGPDGNPVAYDQLDLLKSALDAKGQHYRVVVVQPLTDILLPISDLFTARFTDHNAILVRRNLPLGILTSLESNHTCSRITFLLSFHPLSIRKFLFSTAGLPWMSRSAGHDSNLSTRIF